MNFGSFRGGTLKWLESWKEVWLKKQQDDQESVDLYEEIIRRYYIEP